MKLRLNLTLLGSVATAAALIAANAFAQGGDAPAPATPPATGADTSAPAADGGAPVTPPATPPATPVATPSSEPATPPATAPTTAPAADTTPVTAPSTAPAVSIDVGNPVKKDEAGKKKGDEAEEKKEPTTPIDGSVFFAQAGVSPNVFDRSMQQSSDVSADSFVLFAPRYAFNKNWQVRGRFVFTYEFTDTVDTSTTRKNEPRFGDSVLYLAFRGIPAVAGIKSTIVASAGFPTSPESQARTLYFSPGIGLSFAKQFEHVLGGDVSIALGATYSHPIYAYTTAGLQNNLPYDRQCFAGAGESGCSAQASGAANTENSIVANMALSGEWGKWSPQAFAFLINGWAYQFKDLSSQGVQAGVDPQHFRQSTFLGVALDYSVQNWVQAEVGYQITQSVLDGNSRYANPFYYQYSDGMRVYLGANVLLDKLFLAVSGKSGEAAATAKTKSKPIFSTF